ncbi:formate dehydrogenase accessory sulfurtransferase FdhD [Nonomuraea africana]|uniref:formate dehydrogenase accessory sulfurtransferase FdhD n=1 Tax=Nonomuraea africana TaxID=46171 RepID=UPI0033F877EC
MTTPTTRARITEITGNVVRERRDHLATEEPLEIRLTGAGARDRRTVAITMRTPGHDFELAAGFLHGEGIAGPGHIRAIGYCTDEDVAPEARYNTVTVALDGPIPDLPTLDRHFLTSSACGVCGSASLDVLRDRCAPVPAGALRLSPKTLYGLPSRLRAAQGVFGKTGGLHAAGLFTGDGDLLAAREDVGRHNAVDKLVGWASLNQLLPLRDHVLMVSGRASYEIMQKALAAGVPAVCAVSAPSSLAVELAREFGMTLVGFLREERCNVYAGMERITA